MEGIIDSREKLRVLWKGINLQVKEIERCKRQLEELQFDLSSLE